MPVTVGSDLCLGCANDHPILDKSDEDSDHCLTTNGMGIRNVWKYNLEEEFHIIRKIVQKYNYVAMDTEFPGIVLTPARNGNETVADHQYRSMQCNIDSMRLIQLGLTFMNEEGETPSDCATWQFNFKFNMKLVSQIKFILKEIMSYTNTIHYILQRGFV